MKTATLIRHSPRHDATIGTLTFGDGEWQCETMEPPWRNNANDISCIPAGKYLCRMRKSNKFGLVYEVTGVPGRTDILFHWGQHPRNTTGCILQGRKAGVEDGKSILRGLTKPVVDDMIKFTGGEDFMLEIPQ